MTLCHQSTNAGDCRLDQIIDSRLVEMVDISADRKPKTMAWIWNECFTIRDIDDSPD